MVRIIYILLVGVLLSGCGEGQMGDRFRTMPTSIGKLHQINLVVDPDLWQPELEETFRFYYQGAYLILPQPEPIFDLRVFSLDDILQEPVRRELKVFIKMANLSDQNSQLTQMVMSDLGQERINRSLENDDFGVQIVRDKWARDQLVVYLFGRNSAAISEGVVRSFDQVELRIKEFFGGMLEAEIFGGGENRELTQIIRSKFSADIRIPSDWVKAVESEDFLWIRNEKRHASLSLLFHALDYSTEEQLSPQYLRELRDSITREHISSGKEGTYMEVEDSFLPLFDFSYRINGHYAIELRGIWDMREDFMGGPFKSFLILNENTNRLLFVDAFAYAPAEDKRNHMIRMNHIIQTTNF
ncbi:MAG: DUF4837 family protein [Saprospirales bacterium]|nr:MAG: DUF4837 family protein [Saprospirales bacterium]